MLDRYDTTLVLKLYSAAWLPRLEEIFSLIKEKISCERIVLRMSRNIQGTSRKNNLDQHDGPFLFRFHAGWRAVIFPRMAPTCVSRPIICGGKPTLFFLGISVKIARWWKRWGAEQKSLNAVLIFRATYSVYAARGGAKSVTDPDISAHAVGSAKWNFALAKNFPAVAAACEHRTVQAVALEWIENAKGKI